MTSHVTDTGRDRAVPGEGAHEGPSALQRRRGVRATGVCGAVKPGPWAARADAGDGRTTGRARAPPNRWSPCRGMPSYIPLTHPHHSYDPRVRLRWGGGRG